MKNSTQVSMLLSALSSAITYDDRARQIALVDAGLTWANAKTETDEKKAWAAVAIAAEWRGGFSTD